MKGNVIPECYFKLMNFNSVNCEMFNSDGLETAKGFLGMLPVQLEGDALCGISALCVIPLGRSPKHDLWCLRHLRISFM